jgi:hypothetical protein
MLGGGGADKAGEAILKRKLKIDEADKAPKSAAPAPSLPAQKVKDMSNDPKAYQEYQMRQAIEEVRKKKTATRSAY